MGPRSDTSASAEADHCDGRAAAARRRAFSLPELMIALVILGLGLLIIAAALPVGLDYNRKSADLINGQAAGEYALEVISQSIRLSPRDTRDAIFRPRLDNVNLDSDRDGDMSNDREDSLDLNNDGDPSNDYTVDRFYEPLIKVRAFTMFNIEAAPTTATPTEVADVPEKLIESMLPPAAQARGTLEFDAFDLREANPALSSLARIYPPIPADDRHKVSDFFNGSTIWSNSAGEVERSLQNRLSWTAFHRRVAYPTPGPDGIMFGTTRDEVLPDPNLYEVIVVVTRRPTTEHRFLVQDTTVARRHRASPCAWLVSFTGLPTLTPGVDYSVAPSVYDRPLLATFEEPATLTFQCTSAVGELLPVGSIFIPAYNDDWPTVANDPFLPVAGPPVRNFGFVPHAPTTLPIYKVTARPDATTVVVENNGFYPWINAANGVLPDNWAVWVIPPAVRIEGGQDIFEPATPIVAVERRFIRFRETP